jgi:haloalkane dehalogenase
VPDHIGMGLSDKPTDSEYDYTLQNRVDNLDALVESLDLGDNITLIVHDWGGMIGSTWALRHADRIKKIVILNTAAFGLPEGKSLPWQIGICRSPLGALLVRGLNGFVKGGVTNCVTRHPMTQDVARGYVYPYNSWANRIAVHRFVQDIPLKPTDRGFDIISNTDNNLSKFADKPMLICWGMKDFVFDHHFLKGWTDRFPNADVHRFADAGHYILEDAHEDIVPLVKAFV